MNCPNCQSANPDVAQYCHKCGDGLRPSERTKAGTRSTYAVQSAERVTQFALVSTIMPHTNRESADNYRWGLLIGAGIVALFTLIGQMAGALFAAAVLVPAVYLVYIHDVNLWEEAPLRVILTVFGIAALGGTLVSLVFFNLVFDGQAAQLAGARGGIGGIPIMPLLLFAVLLPIIAEVVKNVAAVPMARNPRYNDMIDALTFGIAAGTAYAAAESIVAFWPVITGFQTRPDDLGGWLLIVGNLMIVKSLVYGTATGIALAAFSGRGEAVDGFTPKYYANFAFAAGVNILYWLGIRLLNYAPAANALGLVWGLAIAAVLIIRVRVMLQAALLEAAVEDAAADRRHSAATTDGGFCPECEMALLADSMFCIVCGTSVRAASTDARRHVRESVPAGGSA